MTEQHNEQAPDAKTRVLLVVSWAWVGIPFAIGVYELVVKASKLFT